MSNVSFGLWHPVADPDRTRYEFDARPVEFEELNAGSAELMQEFLAAMDIDASVSSWEISRFRASYYADDQEAVDWRDRYPVVYRICVTCDPPGMPIPEPRHLGPHGCDAIDPTWEEFGDIGTDAPDVHHPYVVVADLCADRLDEFREAIEDVGSGHGIRCYELTPFIVQARIELGELALPGEEARLQPYLRVMQDLGASGSWGRTIVMQGQRLCE
jgi:hypothetical protein